MSASAPSPTPSPCSTCSLKDVPLREQRPPTMFDMTAQAIGKWVLLGVTINVILAVVAIAVGAEGDA